MRRLLPAIAVIAAVSVSAAGQSSPIDDFKQDFDFAWRNIDSMYAYFDGKGISWSDVPSLYSADLASVRTRADFVALLEHVLDELYDSHAQLTVNLPTSPRLVPSGTDIWAEWRNQDAVITQVRNNSDAEMAGLKASDVVVSINGTSIAGAVEARMGRAYSHAGAAARDWALRAVLAGHHNERRLLQVRVHGAARTIDLPARDQFGTADPMLVTYSELRPGIGYVRVNDSLGTIGVVREFDRALDALNSTRALILDLRNTPSGGNTAIARGILGRFVRAELPYQKHVLVSEEKMTGIRRSWLELVSPRDASYRKPVAVLVGRWTGSMGEGLAIGFDATGAGTVIGTSMAGLLGATYSITLPRTGIAMNLPAERLYHVNGTPREAFQPKVLVDVTASGGDPFVSAALRALGEQ
jgi:C-terminal processing protease CtpA/Prc